MRARFVGNLSQADQMMASELASVAPRISVRLINGVKSRMRKDTGAEQKSVHAVVAVKGRNLTISVRSERAAALVDEEGRRPGAKRPPSQFGSRLYYWVLRHNFVGATSLKTGKRTFRFERRLNAAIPDERPGAGAAKVQLTPSESARRRAQKIARAIAEKIHLRGLPRSGDPLRRPFYETYRAERTWIIDTIYAARDRVVRLLNG